MLAISEHLFLDEGYLFVPYELIYHHPGTIELLNPDKVKILCKGLHDWSSTDTFAHYIVGPARKQGDISDLEIEIRIHSPISW
jgi:hypothetical protein